MPYTDPEARRQYDRDRRIRQFGTKPLIATVCTALARHQMSSTIRARVAHMLYTRQARHQDGDHVILVDPTPATLNLELAAGRTVTVINTHT